MEARRKGNERMVFINKLSKFYPVFSAEIFMSVVSINSITPRSIGAKRVSEPNSTYVQTRHE